MPPTGRGSYEDVHSSWWLWVTWSSLVWFGKVRCNPLSTFVPLCNIWGIWCKFYRRQLIYTGNIGHILSWLMSYNSQIYVFPLWLSLNNMCIICNNWVCIYNWLKTIYCLSGHWSGLVTPNWVYSPSVLIVVQSGPVGLTLSYTINSSFAPGQQPESTYSNRHLYDCWPLAGCEENFMTVDHLSFPCC